MIGIVQGRLSPPVNGRLQAFPADTWQKEFVVAKELGLGCIEWVYDSVENPILDRAAWKEIRRLCEITPARSLCADYFVGHPAYRQPEQFAIHFRYLLECAEQIRHINKVILPFVDNSAIDLPEQFETTVDVLGKVIPYAQKIGIQVCVELSLAPHRVYELLMRFPAYALGICYDIGNSAALGYRPVEEFFWYGRHISHIHIKDRLEGTGKSVPLGEGDANFKSFFKCVRDYKFCGDMILQVARGEGFREWEKAAQDLQFVQRFLER